MTSVSENLSQMFGSRRESQILSKSGMKCVEVMMSKKDGSSMSGTKGLKNGDRSKKNETTSPSGNVESEYAMF